MDFPDIYTVTLGRLSTEGIHTCFRSISNHWVCNIFPIAAHRIRRALALWKPLWSTCRRSSTRQQLNIWTHIFKYMTISSSSVPPRTPALAKVLLNFCLVANFAPSSLTYDPTRPKAGQIFWRHGQLTQRPKHRWKCIRTTRPLFSPLPLDRVTGCCWSRKPPNSTGCMTQSPILSPEPGDYRLRQRGTVWGNCAMHNDGRKWNCALSNTFNLPHLLAQATRILQTSVLPSEKWELISSLLQRGDSHRHQLSQWLIPDTRAPPVGVTPLHAEAAQPILPAERHDIISAPKRLLSLAQDIEELFYL